MTNENDDALAELVGRYVAVWGEGDDAARQEQVAVLWQEDARHVLQTRAVEGRAAITERVAGAYRDLVADKGFAFSLAGDLADGVQSQDDAVTFDVEMAPASGGAPVWRGRIFLLLGTDGRIRCDYQFGRYI